MAELNGIYKSDFDEIRKYIEKFSAKCSEREEALESLLGIYLEAQENQTEISEIHEGTAKDYAKEIAESLPEKKKASLKKILPAATVGFALVFGAVFTILGASEDYLLEKRGLGFVLNNPYEYWVEVSENPQGAYIYYDEKYEMQYESLLKSEIIKTEKGISSDGYIKENGIFADEITVGEEGKTVFIKMHVERTKDKHGNERMISPVFPENKDTGSLTKYGYITHFEAAGVSADIAESYFYGAIRDIYIDKNGNIVFTAKMELEKSDGTDIKAYIENGGQIDFFFKSSCMITWEKKEEKTSFSIKNLFAPKEFVPEYDFMTLEKTSSDGKVTVSFGVFVDKNGKIKDIDGWRNIGYDEEIEMEDTFVEAELSEDGTAVYPLEYKLSSGEIISEKLVFTTEDAKFSFDK